MGILLPALAKLLLLATAASLVHEVKADDAATDSTCGNPTEAVDDLPNNIPPDTYIKNQIQWLKSKKGGFFSPKINYGNLGKGDPSVSGMFAVAPIAKGEEIIHLPAEQLITANMGNGNDYFEDNRCNTAINLAAEYRKGKESNWEPYVTYLFESFPHEHLSSNWSIEAIELFDSIIDEDLEPQNLGDVGLYVIDCEVTEDSILSAAYRIVVSRGWGEVLLPVVDMVNHRNGKWHNVDLAGSAYNGEDISVVALRNIKVGDPIYLSYNECSNGDCLGTAHTFTLPQILSINGFVEQYPRRFNIGVENGAPVFELDKNEDGEIGLTWLNGEPKVDYVYWYHDQYLRLLELENFFRESLTELESHEQYTINAYFQAMLEGLKLASIRSNKSNLTYVQNQIQWLKSKKGGFFSPKINYGNLDKDNPSVSGMFAVAPIAKGEEIIHLPAEQLITANIGNGNDSFKDDACNTAINLAAEYRKGKESSWEPYVTYLFESFPHEHLPPNWSEEAIELFDSIIDDDIEPQSLGERGLYDNYCGVAEDSLLVAAYRIVVGWGEILLPVVDLINHRNGEWHNADQAGSAQSGEDISIVALKDIEVGDQIHLSYNECSNYCTGIAHNFTMPQILADYGFVEQYPRRFNIAEDTPVFELNKDEDGEIEITWLNGEPTIEDLHWFRFQMGRLSKLEDHVEESLGKLESYERYTINTYFQAMLEGIHSVLEWGMKNIIVYNDPDRYKPLGKMVTEDQFQSIYQKIEFTRYNDHNGDILDTCLWLEDIMHACTSLRPHYHEWFVHYPAQFIKQVKRVLFLGGGDNMLLHEVLKYSDLELVIGMELDPTVVRGSFKHFKTEPHYDDERVQWWFGDAAKSLKMLPNKYLGTFDLVVVDLLTEVSEVLMVTDELSIMDFSMLLLNEGGILTLNEELIVATKSEHSQYTVGLEIMDVPVFCQQSIKMLSNSVDFMTVEPIDHGVESIVVNPGVTKKDSKKFDSWWNYHRDTQHKLKERKGVTVDASNNSQGVMIVLEAEEAALSLDSLRDLNDTLTKSLEGEGLTVLSSLSFEKEALVITLKEGYVMLRSWPEHKYCAFDLVLWSSLDKLHAVKDGLVATVGAESISSYNIVTGGMEGVTAVEIPKFPAEIDSDSSAKTDQNGPVPAAFELGDLDAIIKETMSLVLRANPTTIIFCPGKEKPCQSLEALKDVEEVLPIWACASGVSMKRDIACENITLDVMKLAQSQSKITTIIIDPAAPSKMGQMLKKVLLRTSREELLAEQFVLLAPGLDSSKPWYSSLFEWFRADVIEISPSHHAEVLFSSPLRSGKLRMGIFSAGNVDFYPYLVDFTEKCESKFGLETEIPRVLEGKPPKMTCSNPSIVATESSYDRTTADSQWESQNPLGMQTLSQFESPRWPLHVGDRVLGLIDEEVSGRWYPGKVIATHNYNTFSLRYETGEVETGISRQFIRKLDFAGDLTDEEAVFVRISKEISRGDLDFFYLGKVLEKMSSNEYKVHIHNDIGVVDRVNQKDIAVTPSHSEVSCTKLKAMLQNALVSSDSTGKDKLEVQGAGDGCIATALWSQGSAVATWDGGSKMDLNLFTFEEEKQTHETFAKLFLETTSSFGMVSKNQHPRGSGRVVNFKHEMKSFPQIK